MKVIRVKRWTCWNKDDIVERWVRPEMKPPATIINCCNRYQRSLCRKQGGIAPSCRAITIVVEEDER